jgi:glutamate/tyrosine decarboxylase-like PLP-dependent enzyme
MLDKDSLGLLREALDRLDEGYSALPPLAQEGTDEAAMQRVLLEVAERLRESYPYFHPLYAGQMQKPPHEIARLAYALALWINPNNHSLDGGGASSKMEKEVIAELAGMFGWRESLGHLCGGGTMANLEALWVASRLVPGKKVLASEQAHYTHSRLCAVLGLPFQAVPVDTRGRMELDALETMLGSGEVGTVVATMGTTAIGSIDPLPGVLALKARHGFRLHADAAYGGYFRLASNLTPQARAAFARMGEADSIVIDPHKHGLQPYGCGCVLFRDPAVGRFYRHDSPYTYFSSPELHLGEISLECSRAGAAAVGLWATQRMFPLVERGEFARRLERSRAAALTLHERLSADARFGTPFPPELDIVVWAVRAESAEASSRQAKAIFEQCARDGLDLALAELPVRFFGSRAFGDRSTVTCLRSVLMKPEHLDWIDPIWEKLDRATSRLEATRSPRSAT